MIILETNMGEIHINVDADKAPISAKNFTDYVEDGFFDGTIFHRVIPGFMVQGGGMTEDMQQKPTKAKHIMVARATRIGGVVLWYVVWV